MQKYKLKTYEVEAIQWEGTKECAWKIVEWDNHLMWWTGTDHLAILDEVNHYRQDVSVGEWLVRNPDGKLVVYSDILFKQMFEVVKQPRGRTKDEP